MWLPFAWCQKKCLSLINIFKMKNLIYPLFSLQAARNQSKVRTTITMSHGVYNYIILKWKLNRPQNRYVKRTYQWWTHLIMSRKSLQLLLRSFQNSLLISCSWSCGFFVDDRQQQKELKTSCCCACPLTVSVPMAYSVIFWLILTRESNTILEVY